GEGIAALDPGLVLRHGGRSGESDERAGERGDPWSHRAKSLAVRTTRHRTPVAVVKLPPGCDLRIGDVYRRTADCGDGSTVLPNRDRPLDTILWHDAAHGALQSHLPRRRHRRAQAHRVPRRRPWPGAAHCPARGGRTRGRAVEGRREAV